MILQIVIKIVGYWDKVVTQIDGIEDPGIIPPNYKLLSVGKHITSIHWRKTQNI